jgi:lipopolysaccharide transport system ATP-binding protein
MSDTVITVDALSKAYQIGLKERHGRTFRETLTDTLAAPFRRLRSIAAGGNGDGGQEETFWALKDVSFEVKRGEVVGIIGRNGAGKSTLLKILSQITEPTSGEVRLRGRVASLLEVGTGFHPELTGRENIYLNGAILGMKRAEITRKFDEIVAFAEVEKFLDTPVKRYSSGMYVRLAFAVAAHLEPEILIVDEVLAVGDAEFQKKCLGKMQEVSKRGGRTVLFVSHNMIAIRSLCSTAAVLKDGKLSFLGCVVDAVESYLGMGSDAVTAAWSRNPSLKRPSLSIDSIAVKINGDQPRLQLRIFLGLASKASHPPALVAIDIFDLFGGWLMQAIPTVSPFIQHTDGLRDLAVEIDLPPMIPGRYRVGVWVGTHLSETIDEIKECVEFEVLNSPTPGRTIPHNNSRGYFVPTSRVISEERVSASF